MDGAVAFTKQAMTGFEFSGIKGHAAAARLRYGQLIGGDAGREAVEGAEAWMASENIANMSRVAAMLAPGFADLD